MDTNDFINKLNKAQALIVKEEYELALDIIQNLVVLEKERDFPYDLTHKLYQLNSNAISLNNQSKILKTLNLLKHSSNSIEISELQNYLKTEKGFSIDTDTLRKELELLILRDKIKATVRNDVLNL